MQLTKRIGDPDPAPATHVDDWLDGVVMKCSPGEAYARWWLEQARFPAWKQMIYRPLMIDRELFCSHGGKRMRCTGASRMGDVWLTSNHMQSTGYELRVMVDACSDWSPAA